jgi:hypothetical protein
MLGYISSTRKKSCYACVKSKRRCDLGYPFCKRCFVKGIDCKYPNATPRDVSKGSGVVPDEVVIRQTTPDLTPSLACIVDSSTEIPSVDARTSDANIDPFFFQSVTSSDSSGSSSSPESFDHGQLRDDWGVELQPLMPRPLLTRMLVPEVVVPSYLSDKQVLYLTRGLSSFIPAMAYSGSTHFLHKDLYQTHEPQAYQDCVAISALYLAKTARNQRILANSINAKIANLVSASATWTLSQHLAAVQALIIYQIIRLFDPDLNLQAQAEKHNALLELWAAHLWKRAFNEPQSFPTAHSSWVFHESLRRTIIMSVSTRCCWSCATKGGLADQVPVLARLPLTKDLEAWHCEPEDWTMRPIGLLGEERELTSYADLAFGWNTEREVRGLDPFGKMLIAACRGKDDPRLLM